MSKEYSRMLILALAVVIAVGGIAYNTGFENGVASIPAIDRVVDVKNKNSDGSALALGATPQTYADFGPFWRTWHILNETFLPISTSTIVNSDAKVIGAIEGLVNSYNDPYTVFFPPEETSAFKESVRGDFEGIGVTIRLVNGVLTVIEPLKNSPAGSAGIEAGDEIIAIDGTSTVGLSLEESLPHIRGSKGSAVVLTISRIGEKEVLNISVTRGVIEIPTVATAVPSRVADFVKNVVDKVRALTKGDTDEIAQEETDTKQSDQLARNFSIIQLALFAKTSATAFRRELEEFSDTDIDNLIIDLRNNQGGFLDVAVDIASHFLERDVVVVRERSSTAKEERVYQSRGYKTFSPERELNIAILVNKGTASAAEILAGALQEYGKAIIVGEQTFGKGSVQQLIDITDTMALKVTVARWFTPSGVSISEIGITPDVIVNPTIEDFRESSDPILEKAVKILLEKTQ